MTTPRNIWDWLRRQLVDDVPQADALCEFDCRKFQCVTGDWEVCERRLHRAAGELMPDRESGAEALAHPAEASKPAAAETLPES